MGLKRTAGSGVVAGAAILLLLSGCRRDVDLTAPAVHPLDHPVRPAHFPPPHYDLGTVGYSRAGFQLGRRLFHDPLLSLDNSISCASCHRQEAAFSDADRAFSLGVNDHMGLRNSPPVFNMAWSRNFMWDGGITHIEVMPFAPIIDPLEMAEDLNNVVRKLREHPEYPTVFREVFGRSPVDDQQLFLALAQYMGNLVSASSRYDAHVARDRALSPAEDRGLALFRRHCSTCHQEPLFTDGGFHNNGLDAEHADPGRYRVTLDPADVGRFKTPSLRNIAYTAPYMHDGRLATLEAVLDHYSEGIVDSPTLDPGLRPFLGGMALASQEKADLVAFLHALSDLAFVTDPHLSE